MWSINDVGQDCSRKISGIDEIDTVLSFNPQILDFTLCLGNGSGGLHEDRTWARETTN